MKQLFSLIVNSMGKLWVGNWWASLRRGTLVPGLLSASCGHTAPNSSLLMAHKDSLTLFHHPQCEVCVADGFSASTPGVVRDVKHFSRASFST